MVLKIPTILRFTNQTVRRTRCRLTSTDFGIQDAYFADLIQAYREEFKALYALGCRNIQFDDPTFAFSCAESTIEGMRKAGVDPDALLNMYIGVYNGILKDRPADLTIGIHTCRGNYKVCFYPFDSSKRPLFACRALMLSCPL